VSGVYIERGFDGRCLAVNRRVYRARREDFSFEEERDAYCFEEFNSRRMTYCYGIQHRKERDSYTEDRFARQVARRAEGTSDPGKSAHRAV
jgi:hypothetical protein